MAWTYHQLSGEIIAPDGTLAWRGYSGFGIGKNNPRFQHVKRVGPIPRGKYIIGEPYKSEKVGPYALPLTPYQGNEMFGRGDFLIHGDSRSNPGAASEGCIIAPMSTRMKIYDSGDRELIVK